MINIKHLLKVASAWTSIVYTVCYVWMAIYPPVRIMTMRYAFHANTTFGVNYFSLGYFITGLIIWNIVAILAIWLFVWLFKTIKQ
ncbi:MAG: hypothetical protein A2312_00275 [Candidatus Staskawiczbacteria bacterium RIFOXYB2_FULL_32_9]|uniref:Uncharacterized protein n=1 Tax=Candidatus Staskawiczbacteria bacterium RIFOXYD1_FULL_32_13 TaxID=1802234 RepID=A0A1G2JJT9_9BACT|nr:MAG: hypothetical protein UR22_C0017G0016 [Parcubacteria group bacterium GW2011_GWC2_32_10]OGZ77686.1 MAG: hypothetical protein A2256_04400 [Candidatus Staskawiczbacteria bacterium RIFOXYA2_FULL_32_7]OGZ79492.1 MAG: hypothetical protein A2360_02185 [Candidatus Staskawiczbacteria bacterium RIFOXYB1_FULL_32_11]OGZ84860.1 MAG: hypothetical protein A2312_00275 [Candidatus Staskawiczbacteria bacterium RIFOXYB2_FULL_32_9]OGZ85441.1 MAG: hypothetical protein A2463_04320 [Candidatus Staskawiczbacter